MKKLLYFFLITTAVSSQAATSSPLINGIRYELFPDNTCAVVANRDGFTANSLYTGDIWIPETVNYDNSTYTVTTIDKKAFANASGVVSIKLPDTIIQILESAFENCSGISQIKFPAACTTIGKAAFKNCSSLSNVSIPENILTIANGAFYGCKNLGNFIIEDGESLLDLDYSLPTYGITYLYIGRTIPYTQTEEGPFSGLRTVQSLEFGPYYTEIPGVAFADMKALTQIYIPDWITSIGAAAFSGCEAVEAINIGNGVTVIPHNTFKGCKNLKELNFGENVTTIGESAFDLDAGSSYSFGTKFLSLPESLEEIGPWAFNGWGQTEIIYIGSKLKYIYEFGFSSLKSLKAFYCSALTPPREHNMSPMAPSAFGSYGSYESFPYATAIVYVHKDVLETYRHSPLWSFFTHIESIEGEEDPDSVPGLESDDNNNGVEIYTLDGIKVTYDRTALPKGIYIVKTLTTTTKIQLP